jgi:hypothetical protein
VDGPPLNGNANSFERLPMSASYRIDKSRGIVFSTFEGALTNVDILGQRERIESDPEYDPAFAHLIDFRGVSEVDLDAAIVRTVAVPTVHVSGAKRAIVATREAVYGMARMFEQLRNVEHEDVRVFRDVEEARRWLGLD